MSGQKIIGIIPARAGSKGLKNKNIRVIAGKPLLAWSIQSASESKLLTDFFVSTEDKVISSIAREYGAKVIKRPFRLANDSSSIMDVLLHALDRTKADIIVLLQPTSPVRNRGLVDKCLRKYLSVYADSLATGYVCKIVEYGTEINSFNRQSIEGFFYDDGNIYILNKDLVKKGLKIGANAVRIIISREENMEIDDKHDFFLVEQVLLKRRNKKWH